MCAAVVIAELFRLATESFAPWIQPLDNSGQMLSPWIMSDEDTASQLVADWLRVVEHLFVAFRGRFSEQLFAAFRGRFSLYDKASHITHNGDCLSTSKD